MKRKYIKPTTEVFASIEEPMMNISGGVNNSGQSEVIYRLFGGDEERQHRNGLSLTAPTEYKKRYNTQFGISSSCRI